MNGMTRDEARGQSALLTIDQYVEPQSYYISGDTKLGRQLYKLENKRSEIIEQIAEIWARIADVDKSQYWKQSVPQVLHDTLENYQTECGIIAAEAFLKRHGWQVVRPQKRV